MVLWYAEYDDIFFISIIWTLGGVFPHVENQANFLWIVTFGW